MAYLYIKDKWTEKEEVKISVYADDMIVYISEPKTSFREFLNLINNFSEVARYKIRQISGLSLHKG